LIPMKKALCAWFVGKRKSFQANSLEKERS
jgi:hypothetical protein